MAINTSQIQDTAEALQARRDRWQRENRGVFTRIARELGVAHNTVRLSFIGATRTVDPKIAQALREAGAPGFAE